MPPIGITFPGERSGWSPDPIMIAEDIGIAERKLKRMQVPLNQARYIIAENIQEHFQKQEDYDNLPWQEWSPSYDARQQNLGDILERTYAMEYAATNPDNYLVISHSVSAGAYGGGEVAILGSSLPDYWIWHEQGLPERRTKSGAPNPLPKRSFMGLDTEGEEKIYEVFDRFVDRALVGTLVTGQPLGRGGRFATRF
jgi:hypothetical protein